MTAATTDVPKSVLLPGVHRAIRAIESHEGPFSGVLVTRGDGVAVRVDATELIGWDGWRFAGSEHVVGPLDIVRRVEGHDVLLPWCTERVGTFVARRDAVDEGLTSGECCTLLVSLFRAMEELGCEDAVVGATGTWWLTDEGRPVFVLGEGEESRVGVALLVAQLGERCADKTLGRLLAAVEEAIRANLSQQPRVPRLLWEKWEQEVLEIAAPRALRRDIPAAEKAAAAVRAGVRWEASPPPPRRALRGARRGAARRGGRVTSGRGMVLSSLAARAAGLALVVRERGNGLRRRSRRERASASRTGREPSTTRRRAVLVAGGAAAVVLTAGLLWPSGDASEATSAGERAVTTSPGSDSPDTSSAESSAPSPEAESSDLPSPSDSSSALKPPVEGTSADDPVVASSALLAEIRRCATAQDDVCAEAIATGSSGALDTLSGVSADAPAPELVDSYGDAAVIRLISTPADGGDESPDEATTTEHIMVLVRVDEKWLVRDVYDVADQPE